MDESQAKPTEPMSEGELMAIVNGEIDRGKDFTLGPIGKERATAYDYYYGRKFGNEVEGRSQIISHDVAQQVDSAVPALIKFFAGSEKAVEFTARQAEDVPVAEQATEVANYVFYTQNNGFLLLHDAIKNALLQKTGCFKWYWDKSVKVEEEIYSGVSPDDLALLQQDPSIEIINTSPPNEMGLQDAVVRKKKESGKAKVVVVPPDELLVADNAYGLEADDIPCVIHRRELTLSELVEMGYDYETVMSLPAGSQGNDTYESVSRDERTGWSSRSHEIPDPMMKKVWYCETYIKLDFDRDGIAERRKVCSVEGNDKPLHNEVCPEVPFSFGTTKIMPHEFYGVSMADDIMDLQLKKSSLLRNAWDNLALAITPRMAVNTQQVTNLDDVMTIRMGGVIRSDGDVSGAIQPVVVPFLGQHIFPMVEYIDSEGETRTGVSRLFQGVDPNTLNKTATGVNALMNAAQARLELTARGLAETLIKPMFRGIMSLMSRHQDEAQALTIRLRNQYIPIDPRVWATDYDMTVNVGLGTGTKDQQLQHLMALGADVAAVAQSPFAPVLLTPDKVFNLFKKKCELAGFKDAAQFMNDPSQMDPAELQQKMQPPPNPEIQKAEMQIAADEKKFAAESQMGREKMAQEGQQAIEKANIDAAVAKYKAELDAKVKLQVEAMRAELEHERESNRIQIDGANEAKRVQNEGRPAVQLGGDETNTALSEAAQHLKGQGDAMNQAMAMMNEGMKALAQAMSRPRTIVRGKDGKAIGVQ